MIVAAAPTMMTPVLCGRTIPAVFAKQFAGYGGPNAAVHFFDGPTDGPWAYVGWGIGEEGGQSVLHYANGRWCRIAGGGGALDEASLTRVAGPYYGPRLWHKMWKNR